MIKQIILTFLISISLTLSDIVTFRFECDFPGGTGPQFYGFPFIYRTEIPWVNSLSGNFYFSGFIGNLIFNFALVFFALKLMKRLKLKSKIKKVFIKLLYSITAILLVIASLKVLIIEWRFEWKDNFYENYGGKAPECDRHPEILKF